jgi:peptidyl-prolyl cis-trans isomerase SurA
MTLNLLRTSAAFVFSTVLLASSTLAQTHAAAPESAYGGVVVEDIVARVNDQIITRSDYDRAMKQLDDEARQRGATMQQISEGHKDLLRDLIDQQLWLSKGKELEITGETELVQKLNEIRKQYNLETIDDLEKAAKEQGVSFEDFKASIRNQIVTQQVMRDQVGRRIQITPGEVQRYFDQHKQEYTQPESVHLSEILISGGADPSDAAADAAAKAKVDDIEAKLHAGGDFTQLAKNFSDGSTAAEGGDLGEYLRGKLNPVFETKAFALKTGDYTEPIRTKQGYVILKVVQHIPGGVPALKDVEDEVEQNYYMSRMAPAIREYLTTMRGQAYIFIKPGYEDSAASPSERNPTITFSSYTPPAPKKKKKVERTRFRESTRTFRQKSPTVAGDAAAAPATMKNASLETKGTEKPGKKEKIRFGKAPTKTLPNAPQAKTEDAGAVQPETASAAQEPANPLEPTARQEQKTRFSARAKLPKPATAKGPQTDKGAPPAPDAAEVADRQVQAEPLGPAGDSAKKKKKSTTTSTDKTRLADKNKNSAAPAADSSSTPSAPTPQTPPPAPTPQQ